MGVRVLMIEDEVGIADFVVRGLREEGYTVEHAADGIDGWHRLNSETWDAVLLDWWLPGEDGIDILARYRQTGGTVPILMLTARDAIADRVRGLDTGAEDFLCKPFAFEELLARLRSLVRRRDARSQTLLNHSGVQYDIVTQRAERDGIRLEITPKEQAILVYFLRHPGEVLSRTRIYETVWEEAYDGLSNSLEVHIAEIRRKLEAVGPRLIETVRGRGYVFAPGSES